MKLKELSALQVTENAGSPTLPEGVGPRGRTECEGSLVLDGLK